MMNRSKTVLGIAVVFLFYTFYFVSGSVVEAEHKNEAEEKVLNIPQSSVPDLRPSHTADPRSSNSLWAAAGRSVNLSFFIPAFSLFALASQLMPNMFPNLSTATTSSRGFQKPQRSAPNARGRIFRSRGRGSSKKD